MERVAYRMELRKRRVDEIIRVKRKIALILLISISIVLCIYMTLQVNAYNESNKTIDNESIQEANYTPEIHYTSHQVVKGSSLWHIASEVNTELELSIKDTIELLKVINNLNTDDLYEGQSIIVPYLKDISLYV